MSEIVANEWCRALGIRPPRLAAVAGHSEANTFALLLVALLECGQPLTLVEVAARFEQAGIAERARALLSLQRCKPGRPPVYREGDRYHLDPHDGELELWVFRLGLRPPKVAPRPARAIEPEPIPGPDIALGSGELDEAWKDASLFSWSAQRLALAVLDAHAGPLEPADVVAAVGGRTKWFRLDEDAAKFKRRGSAIEVLADGRWAIAAEAGDAVKRARTEVRERVAMARRWAAQGPDPAVFEQRRAEWERERAARAAELAKQSHALIVAFPPNRPRATALLDVGAHEIATFIGEELATFRARLADYDVLGAVDVRGLLRALAFDPGGRRLAELGPPQKSKQLNRRGRTLKITTALLVQGSCGIGKPFGDQKKLAEYLARGELAKLRRRLAADLKSLHALYEYGRLHGAVRLRWGFLDERIPAPWAHRDEPRLGDLEQAALEVDAPLEVVVGSAPGWADPWSRSRLVYVETDGSGWCTWLVGEDGLAIDEAEVQRARFGVARHGHPPSSRRSG